MFHIKNLHIGHLAKAFALRDAPGNITQQGASAKQGKGHKSFQKKASKSELLKGAVRAAGKNKGDPLAEHDNSAEQRMQDVVRAQGRLSRKGGVMMSSGASEFHVAGGHDLERLVAQR